MTLSIQTLATCLDPSVAGGKAAGLARLLQAGFNVPPGLCVTAEVYRDVCRQVGLDAQRDWERARDLPAATRGAVVSAARAGLSTFPWPSEWSSCLHEAIEKIEARVGPSWAVRSSATDEDLVDAGAAGLYRTQLGVTNEELVEAILRCWESLWEDRVFEYYRAKFPSHPAPTMAVIIQPMVAARVSGVAFSRHPISGRTDEILINAVPGLAEPMASGRIAPDEYVVTLGSPGLAAAVSQRHVTRKPFIVRSTLTGIASDRLPPEEGSRSSLSDDETLRLALLVHRVEQALGSPVDVEWAFDHADVWLLQARPISGLDLPDRPTNEQCDWSRANFKETLPELPSPLGFSFLEQFMEQFMLSHYRELGCVIPDEWPAARAIQGRPFINVTLFQSCVAQLGGHPERVAEQMGGTSWTPARLPDRLPLRKLIRAALLIHRKIRRAVRRAPVWFEELKRTAATVDDETISNLSSQELIQGVEWLGNHLRQGECTFAIVAAVGQAQQVLGWLLPRWIGPEWRSLLNAALQGQDCIISARQVRWLRQIAERARHEPTAMAFFLSGSWNPSLYRKELAGTDTLRELDTFLAEYGHRAIGESDMMSPRFSEDPAYLLEVVRRYLLDAPRETAEQAAARQRTDRATALGRIRRRFGWRYDRWLAFRWWYARLCRANELREANRHYLMYYAAATRRLLLALGRRLAACGRLTAPDDVFFVTTEELTRLPTEPAVQDWTKVVTERRAAYHRYAQTTVPDFIPATGTRQALDQPRDDVQGTLRGMSISAGIVEGRVAVVRSREDIAKVRHGDIIVMPVIDPGMAALFGLAGGVIADMGGTLSHGAIIVREYGIPGIVNVADATRLLQDGERVRLNAVDGLVHRIPA